MRNSQLVACLFWLFAFAGNGQESNFTVLKLNETQLENTAIFAKSYGIIRHFDPSTSVEKFELWEEFLILGIQEVLEPRNSKKLNFKLNELFSTMSSAAYFSDQAKKSNEKKHDQEITDSVCYKLNCGWGDKGRARARLQKFERFYTSSVEKIRFEDLPVFLNEPNVYATYQMGVNTFLFLPQSRYLKNGNSQSRNQPKPAFEIFPIDTFHLSDPYVRIGAVIIFWNVMQHFYPYLDVSDVDTEQLLKTKIEEAAACDSKMTFLTILQGMCHDYKDNHAIVIEASNEGWEQYMPPIKLEEIQDKIRVVWIKEGFETDLKIGDEVIAINAIPIAQFFEQKKALFSGATERYNKFVAFWHLLEGQKNETINITLKTQDGRIVECEMKQTLNVWDFKNYPQNEITYTEYETGYFYVNMANLSSDTLSFLMDSKFPQANGLILDLRNTYYHERGKELLGHFSSDTLRAQPMFVPTYYFPNQVHKNSAKKAVDTDVWNIPPQSPKYTTNVVFILDHQMYSGRETEAAIIDHFKLGTTVGRPTGGTNGNTSIVKLFDSYQFFFSGMEVLQYDSTTFHGIGIAPTIFVEQSLEDLYNGQDSFIEKAKSILK